MKLLFTLFATSSLLGLQLNAYAAEQRPKANFPETEIFLLDLDLDSNPALSNVLNATNREGYDNQPFFTHRSKSFLYSRGDDYQTDVFEYHLESAESKRVTDSEATEFSPMSFADDEKISFVTDRSASIWFANRASPNKATWAQAHNRNKEPIGYYAWNHETGDILYWSQYGFSVSLVHESTQNYHFVSGHAVPATPHVIPDSNKFSFVHRQSNGQMWIKEFDPESLSTRPLIPTVGNNANYTWAPDGSILMIERDVLYRWNGSKQATWQPIADLESFGITKANRVAVSPDAKKIAIVGLPAPAVEKP